MMEELGKQGVQNGTCDIFVHLRSFCWDFDCVCTENVLQWKKKTYTLGNSLKIEEGQKKIDLFSVLNVIVHACLSREGDRFVFRFEME